MGENNRFQRTKTRFEKNLDILSTVVLIGTIVWVAVMWRFLPERIPRHYDVLGKPDAWSGRGILIFDVATEVGLYLLMLGTKKFPQLWNVPQKDTREGQEKVLTYSARMLSVVNLALVVTFTYMTICSGLSKPLGGSFIWFSLGGALIPVIYYTVKMYR